MKIRNSSISQEEMVDEKYELAINSYYPNYPDTGDFYINIDLFIRYMILVISCINFMIL